MSPEPSGFTMQPTVTEAVDAARRDGWVLVACDVSPPRGAAIDTLPEIARIPADFYCVAYAPGRAVRLDSLAMATVLRAATGRGQIFNLATRDMNTLALENHLLGAEALGQPNVAVVRGDDLTDRDKKTLKVVHNLTPTGLLEAISAMNDGRDLRGSTLRQPSRLCAGATLDLARDHAAEVVLMAKKVRAGARFLLTQPVYEPAAAEQFLALYRSTNREELDVPVFWGFPVLAPESITFGEPPARWRDELAAGRPGADLAAEEMRRFVESGITTLYVMPPILRGGVRDYTAAARAIADGLGRRIA
ncbi:MAG: methylenetetrahydrofolate reductase [Dehalococcoidia bacterium]